jgi:hypothetical protein
MTSRHGSQAPLAHTEENNASRNIRPVHFPFTTHVCRRLWRLALFFPEPAGR